ncbi:phosphopantetheine-binding protein [Herbivorax sp. ANBcel31]|uniref:acyl carrier protein n=1 Tax=Herbivorax sp. ANBcel31 TaxID=3069754 RepID=UPI0027B383C1|nr:phosphopantetheine-binding protein [Herbivorax sp. ANBcel31]MDQ2086505.1 phosphopantetheine-binding protein [Herbivorax sp. ANBcel31]
MEESKIKKETIELIESITGKKDINNDTPLIGKGGIMDSVTAANFINSLEEKFKIFFMHEDLNLESFSNIDSLISLIQKYSE